MESLLLALFGFEQCVSSSFTEGAVRVVGWFVLVSASLIRAVSVVRCGDFFLQRRWMLRNTEGTMHRDTRNRHQNRCCTRCATSTVCTRHKGSASASRSSRIACGLFERENRSFEQSILPCNLNLHLRWQSVKKVLLIWRWYVCLPFFLSVKLYFL